MNLPTIVCLCGSTRFYDAFQKANFQETLRGNIVLTVGFMMHHEGAKHGGDVGITERDKAALDELHLRKIDLADEVLVLNVGDYIGDSTRREIWYAQNQGKRIRFWEPSVYTSDHIRRWFLDWNDWVAAAKKAASIEMAASRR